MQEPFSISPNPKFLYLTDTLKTTLMKISHVLDRRRGLTVILGDVGMGKSSLIRKVYGDYVARDDVTAVFIPTPGFNTELAFLKTVCKEFDLAPKRTLLDQEEVLREYLINQYVAKKNCILFIDEAQRLSGKQLEQVRTMLNFETDSEKLIQVVLAGQLELRDRLRDESKKAIRSRIFAPSLLDTLSPDEAEKMIEFRCASAGIAMLFVKEQVTKIYDASAGVPREILKICDLAYALMLALKLPSMPDELLNEAIEQAALKETDHE
jgi:general secretion pathway protein A